MGSNDLFLVGSLVFLSWRLLRGKTLILFCTGSKLSVWWWQKGGGKTRCRFFFTLFSSVTLFSSHTELIGCLVALHVLTKRQREQTISISLWDVLLLHDQMNKHNLWRLFLSCPGWDEWVSEAAHAGQNISLRGWIPGTRAHAYWAQKDVRSSRNTVCVCRWFAQRW